MSYEVVGLFVGVGSGYDRWLSGANHNGTKRISQRLCFNTQKYQLAMTFQWQSRSVSRILLHFVTCPGGLSDPVSRHGREKVQWCRRGARPLYAASKVRCEWLTNLQSMETSTSQPLPAFSCSKCLSRSHPTPPVAPLHSPRVPRQSCKFRVSRSHPAPCCRFGAIHCSIWSYM